MGAARIACRECRGVCGGYVTCMQGGERGVWRDVGAAWVACTAGSNHCNAHLEHRTLVIAVCGETHTAEAYA